jgi:hypothetical protein
MGEHNAVVAIYNTHTEAEAAIKELKGAAFDIAKLSIVRRSSKRPIGPRVNEEVHRAY